MTVCITGMPTNAFTFPCHAAGMSQLDFRSRADYQNKCSGSGRAQVKSAWLANKNNNLTQSTGNQGKMKRNPRRPILNVCVNRKKNKLPCMTREQWPSIAGIPTAGHWLQRWQTDGTFHFPVTAVKNSSEVLGSFRKAAEPEWDLCNVLASVSVLIKGSWNLQDFFISQRQAPLEEPNAQYGSALWTED